MFALLRSVDVEPGIAAAAALGAQAIATGFLHEDGLADVADGLGARGGPEERLAIMRDSRIGAFGAGALILALLAKWSAVASMEAGEASTLLIAVAAASRAAMVAVMWALPHARPDGLSAMVGRPSADIALAAIGLGALALLLGGWSAFAAGAAVALVAWAVAQMAMARLGGQTGDVLGAVQVVAEIAALAMLA